VSKYRLCIERSPKPTCLIIDSQSVKNTDSCNKETKGYDGGKKISGIKRHILVDTLGLPQEIKVTPANYSEREVMLGMMQKTPSIFESVQTVLADSGYTGERLALDMIDEVGLCLTVIPRNKVNQFEIVPKRWVVERSFAWLDKCRRLFKNVEGLIKTSETMIKLCFIRLIARRLVEI
jgi:transposase